MQNIKTVKALVIKMTERNLISHPDFFHFKGPILFIPDSSYPKKLYRSPENTCFTVFFQHAGFERPAVQQTAWKSHRHVICWLCEHQFRRPQALRSAPSGVSASVCLQLSWMYTVTLLRRYATAVGLCHGSEVVSRQSSCKHFYLKLDRNRQTGHQRLLSDFEPVI